MAEKKVRLSQVIRKLNIGLETAVKQLQDEGFEVDKNLNAKIPASQFDLLKSINQESAADKEEASNIVIGTTKKQKEEQAKKEEQSPAEQKPDNEDEEKLRIRDISLGQQEAEIQKEEAKPQPEKEAEKKETPEETPKEPKAETGGLKVLGKIELDKKGKPVRKKEAPKAAEKQEEPTEQAAPEAEAEKQTEEEKPAAKAESKEAPKTEAEPEPKAKPLEAKTEEPKAEVPKAEETKENKTEEAKEEPKEEGEKAAEKESASPKANQLQGLKVVGKIDLPVDKAREERKERRNKRKRKRVKVKGDRGTTTSPSKAPKKGKKPEKKEEITDKEIEDKIKATLAKLSGNKGGKTRAKNKRDRRKAAAEAAEQEAEREEAESTILKVTEFISANDLASLMDVSVNDIISAAMSMGMFVSINQRLDAEAITILADEFNYDVKFVDSEDELAVEEEVDDPETLMDRAPIVTIMGHVDHGKTSLLDYIREAKVTEGEAGGITQHIGAYDVKTESGKRIAFLDTPGHEAFTAMRARGAKVTDVAIIVIAADDAIMPQTEEAINHATMAEVPIVFAFNKMDKEGANADKIRQQLAEKNMLVEEWGGKYQSTEISAKTGMGIDELLEKVLLEAEMLELKATIDKKAVGTVIEASLDKGRGYLATLLVQSGKMKVGDTLLAGAHYGKIKAMFDHRGHTIEEAGPSTPVQVLGLNGAPQAGDRFNLMDSDREARDLANKRAQVQREQMLRTRKHITLEEIGRRRALDDFSELNIIIKGDVDGSVEALSDSLLKLSTDEVKVSIIHKGVGQISESDVNLAIASDAIILGFQVRPTPMSKRLAEGEDIQIKLYSVIYDAIEEIKDAMEGMLSPKIEEVVIGNGEVREAFKISKVGTVAGCYLTDGVIKRKSKVRVLRDFIVIHTGEIDALKRFKEDVAEVKHGYEFGLKIQNFNDIQVDDAIEVFEEQETKRTLD